MQCLDVCVCGGGICNDIGEGEGALLVGIGAVRADGGGGHVRRVVAHVGLWVGAMGTVLGAIGCMFETGGFVAFDEGRVERW